MKHAAVPVSLGLLAAVHFLSAAPAFGQVHTLTGRPACDTCRIRIAAVQAYGSRSDSLGLAGPLFAAGHAGNVYVVSEFLSMPGAVVFDRNGSLLRMLGRSGTGPGEFGQAVRIAAGRTEVFVQDRSGMVQVFGPNDAFRRSLRGIPRPLTNLVSLGDSVLVIAGSALHPAGGADRPVHTYDARSGSVIGSSGPIQDLRPGQTPSVTRVAEALNGNIWIIEPPDVVGLWSTDGRLLLKLQWSPEWIESVDPAFRGITANERSILDRNVWHDRHTGLLWVLSLFSDPRGDDPFPTMLPGEPLPDDYFSPARLNANLSTIISVVDPERGTVLTHLRISGAADQFLDDGRLLLLQEDHDGHQWLQVFQLELVPR